MKKEDFKFRKDCSAWHIRVKQLLKNGEIDKVVTIRQSLQESLNAWIEREKEAKIRTRLLKSLLMSVSIDERMKRTELKK